MWVFLVSLLCRTTVPVYHIIVCVQESCPNGVPSRDGRGVALLRLAGVPSTVQLSEGNTDCAPAISSWGAQRHARHWRPYKYWWNCAPDTGRGAHSATPALAPLQVLVDPALLIRHSLRPRSAQRHARPGALTSIGGPCAPETALASAAERTAPRPPWRPYKYWWTLRS
jgi:hypothetical protein